MKKLIVGCLIVSGSMLAQQQEFRKPDVIFAFGKPQSTTHSRCTGDNPNCPAGAKEAVMHYPKGAVRLTRGWVYAIEGDIPIVPSPDHSKRDKFIRTMDTITNTANGAADEITLAKACNQVRQVPILLMSAKQAQLLQACIAAGY